MKIIIEPLTLKRASERGANESEIIEVINNGFEISTKNNRLAKAKIFDYNSIWNEKHYQKKGLKLFTLLNQIVSLLLLCFCLDF